MSENEPTSRDEPVEDAALLRAILETAVEGIITIGVGGTIRTINGAAERMFGYEAGELIGRSINELMPSPFATEHNGYIETYLRTGRKKIIGIGRDVVGLRNDGTTFPMNLSVGEVLVGGKRLFTGIVRDLTELKRAQQRLLQSERLAAIGQMTTGLAHESRNALQRTQACLEMLALEVGEQPEAIDLVARIQAAQDHLHQLFEEVGGYAAPIHLQRRRCDVRRLWRSTWADLELVRAAKAVRLEDDGDTADTNCIVDPFTIGQVFRNVFENAIAAVPDGGRIRVRCEDVELGGIPALRVCVGDDGPGLDAEQQQKVFEPFFTSKAKGTGLGMAIVHRIVEAHRGRISAGNGSLGGAEFQITLPRGSE